MKTLLLLRHAKSSWKHAELPDHDRPLKKRGRQAAAQMGRRLQKLRLVPDHILSSSATRAIATAQLTAEAANINSPIETVSDLYHANPIKLAAIVSQVPDSRERVLVVGHNPGLADWLALLIGRVEEFPTAALAQIELPISSWRELSLDTRGDLKGLWTPKTIAE